MNTEEAIQWLKRAALVEKSAKDDYVRYAAKFTDPVCKQKLEWASKEEARHQQLIEETIAKLEERRLP